jgi:hypothetical protein
VEFTGLIQKFKVNRPLSDEERVLRLQQKQRIDRTPADQLCCIRINSTYLEMVDVYYGHKGWLSGGVIAGWLIAGGGMLWIGWLELVRPTEASSIWTAIMFFAIGIVSLAPALWFLRFECFRYTHYPIRFNRKTRKVHVFRVDGTVLTADWDQLFFCLGRCYQRNNWTVQGHVLDKDRNTVLETFSLSFFGVGNRDRELLKQFWEFVRRYMENGPAAVKEYVTEMLPIADRRQSFLFGLYRTAFEAGPLGILLIPFYILFYPGRWFALHSCKIPRWPEEIEASSRIEPGDPHVRDASTNPKYLRR